MLLREYYKGCICQTSFSHVNPGQDEYAAEAWERQTQKADCSFMLVPRGSASYYDPLVVWVTRELWYKWFDRSRQ